MSQEFEISNESELPATPEEVWEAVATGPGNLGWLFPMEVEPRVGGIVSRGPCIVTAWDPPSHFACRFENEAGLVALLDYFIEPRGENNSFLRDVIRRVNSGAPFDDWETQTYQADTHMVFYCHALDQYLRYFKGRAATFVHAAAPEASSRADGFTVVRRALGLAESAGIGEEARVDLPGFDPIDAVVDYASDLFIGLRSSDALYRFFGLNAWGWKVDVGHHLFADDIDQEKAEHAWRNWLEAAFA